MTYKIVFYCNGRRVATKAFPTNAIHLHHHPTYLVLIRGRVRRCLLLALFLVEEVEKVMVAMKNLPFHGYNT